MGVIAQILPPFLGTLLSYGFYKLFKLIRLQWTSPLRILPGPKSRNPLLGNALEFLANNGSIMHEKWFEYGSTYKFHGILNLYVICTKDSRALAHILSHTDIYQKSAETRRSLSRVFGEGLLTAEGDQHKRQRKVMNPAFGPAQVRALTGVFTEKATMLRDRISELLSPGHAEGTRVNVLSWLSKTTLDVIGEAGFNYRFNALDPSAPPNELNVLFNKLFNGEETPPVLSTLQDVFPVLRIIPNAREKQIVLVQTMLASIGNQLLEDAKTAVAAADEKTGSGIDGRDLLTLLVKANMGESATRRLSDADVLAQVPTFLIAGQETTSSATTWALFALAQYPEIQTKLRDECLTMSTDTPSMEQLDSLTYLDWVVRETMRVYPPVPGSMRVAMKDDVIPLEEPFTDAHGIQHHSFRVPKGADIVIQIIGSNLAKDTWGPDAASYRPERWEAIGSNDAANAIPGVWGSQLSFLGGPRGCIGFRFAIVEMKALLYTLIRAFEFNLAVPVEDIVATQSLVSRPSVRSEPKVGNQMPLLIKPFLG
ncbi:cytochrome P450 [Athelia psychrophila]|uniref:Cytochrome P450 n=1 Tax=Athelia psychrophila TaxID=1759441 RepID=A0A166RHP4_9AGAM|nr:cytochrome P450 [Fibularhizoctonia sp. CBS 109695]